MPRTLNLQNQIRDESLTTARPRRPQHRKPPRITVGTASAIELAAEVSARLVLAQITPPLLADRVRLSNELNRAVQRGIEGVLADWEESTNQN